MRIPATGAHNRWHPDLEPVATVRPGDEITLETRDGLDGQLAPDSSHTDVLALDLGLGHPLTGPVYVDGAEPGDVVDVEFVAYETADFGVTAVIPGFGYLARSVRRPLPREMGHRRRPREIAGAAGRGPLRETPSPASSASRPRRS